MVSVRLSFTRMAVLWKDVDKGIRDITVFEHELPDAARHFRKLGPFFEEQRGKPTFHQLKSSPEALGFLRHFDNDPAGVGFVCSSRVESQTEDRLGGNVRREVRIYYDGFDVPCAISRWKEGEGVSFIVIH